MPAPRKSWLPSGDQSSPKRTTLSPAQHLADQSSNLQPSIPMWVLSSLITALLGRDNRKIPPTRTEQLLKALEDFIPLMHAVEAQGIELPQAMKDQFVAWFTRDILKTRPPAHPRYILALHSHLVDIFLQDKGWPITKEGNRTRYKSALTSQLPILLAELANSQHCNSGCSGNRDLEVEDVESLGALTSAASLRDAIVALHHGIAPDSMRGARAGRTFQRHRKK